MPISYSHTQIWWDTGAQSVAGGDPSTGIASGVYDMQNMTVGGVLWIRIVNSANSFTYPAKVYMEISNYHPAIEDLSGNPTLWYPMEGAGLFTAGAEGQGRGLLGSLNSAGEHRRAILIPNAARWMRVVAYRGSHTVTVYAKFTAITVYT